MFVNIESLKATVAKLSGYQAGGKYTLDSLILALYISVREMPVVMNETAYDTLKRWESTLRFNATMFIRKMTGSMVFSEKITIDLTRQILTTRQDLVANFYSTVRSVLELRSCKVTEKVELNNLSFLISSSLDGLIQELPNYEVIPHTFYMRLKNKLREEMSAQWFTGEEQAKFDLYHKEITEIAFGVARAFFYITANNCTVDRPYIKVEDSCRYAIQVILDDYIENKETLEGVAKCLAEPLMVRAETPDEDAEKIESDDTSEPSIIELRSY